MAALHSKWVKAKGALCAECQELNALHSQSVDGAGIKIPDRLTTPPEPTEPYIIDLLEEQASAFAAQFLAQSSTTESINGPSAEDLVVDLLRGKHRAVSEYELFQIACRIAKDGSFSLLPYLQYLDFGALKPEQKHAICVTLNISRQSHPQMWNSLFYSDILSYRELYERALDQPFSLQRLYSSRLHSTDTFFIYLRRVVQDFTRKIILIRVRSPRIILLYIWLSYPAL